ncbi:MAG TPA: DUF6051 family protein, partial [Candidatus Mcinerneyibacteriales bacterium]|nr:DUF6051 family protein [Candidatus Mcinerneyibacteriales bacterium]
ETVNLLRGNDREIPLPVDIKDPPYPYSHIKPFSEGITRKDPAVESFFSEVFDTASLFFTKS